MRVRCTTTRGEWAIGKIGEWAVTAQPVEIPLEQGADWKWDNLHHPEQRSNIKERFDADIIFVCEFEERGERVQQFACHAVTNHKDAYKEITRLTSRDRDTTPEVVDLILWRDLGEHRGGFQIQFRPQKDDYSPGQWISIEPREVDNDDEKGR